MTRLPAATALRVHARGLYPVEAAVEIHDNLLARIAEAEQEGWAGEVEALKVSLAGAQQKLAQLDQMTHRATTIHLGIPAFRDIAGRDIAGEEPS